MSNTEVLLLAMRQFFDVPSGDALERVRSFTAGEMAKTLRGLNIDVEDVVEIVDHWNDFRRDESWVALLAAFLATVESQRGNIDAPISIWPDLDAAGTSGRLFYFYLFALSCDGVRTFLRAQGASDDVIATTFHVLARHAQVHQRKWGTTGVDAGWWMVPTLRGEFVHVGSLQFHRVHLGVGSLSPSPWYTSVESAALGVGFHDGDESLGIHIPQDAPLAPHRLDETFDLARSVLGRMWPTTQRRIATCQSWLLDDQLADPLGPTSNIVGFQRRFELLPDWYEDNEDS
jgi:hypothetical protein